MSNIIDLSKINFSNIPVRTDDFEKFIPDGKDRIIAIFRNTIKILTADSTGNIHVEQMERPSARNASFYTDAQAQETDTLQTALQEEDGAAYADDVPINSMPPYNDPADPDSELVIDNEPPHGAVTVRDLRDRLQDHINQVRTAIVLEAHNIITAHISNVHIAMINLEYMTEAIRWSDERELLAQCLKNEFATLVDDSVKGIAECEAKEEVM